MNNSPQSWTRQSLIQRLDEPDIDLLVIGGGATGAGIALDAASRGLKTVLVEKGDFASGTSSRSTKLIHGGLRYLKQLEIGLVREVGRERAIVHRLAPHLVVPEKMLLPFVKGGNFNKFTTSLALWVYDFLAGVKGDDKRKMLSKAQSLKREPLLNHESLLGAGLYAEYRTDDARLTVELIKSALEHGAVCLNYFRVDALIYENEKVTGASLTDTLSADKRALRAKVTVNAAGPWVDELRDMDHSLKGKRLHLTKGVHLVVDQARLPLKQSVYFDMPDGRMIFTIPRGRITYIGTTDTDYKGDKNHPRTSVQDVEYLLHGANQMFPGLNLTIEDVESSWAGLRPLIHEDGKSASELSRKDEVFHSASGLISIAGGKLTGYRQMALKVTGIAWKIARPGKPVPKCKTDQIDLIGGDFNNYPEVLVYEQKLKQALSAAALPESWSGYLVHNYGTQSGLILDLLLAAGNPMQRLTAAELQFTWAYELAQTPLDFLNRRTGRLYFDIPTARETREQVIAFFSQKMNWDAAQIAHFTAELDEAFEGASAFTVA